MNTVQTRQELEAEAIANCDTDPIHLLNAIQTGSWLVATDRSFEHVRHVSANVDSLFDGSLTQIMATVPGDLFPASIAHSIRNAAGHRTIEHQREYLGGEKFGSVMCDVTVHAANDCLIIEIQPVLTQDTVVASLADVQLLLARINEDYDLNKLLDTAVQNLRDLCGYDRVKAYRFLPDGAGEIVAESARAGVESFLGRRFPAFDIPRQARKLYLTTPIRVIADVQAGNVKLVSAEPGAAPPDLSLALIRGTVDVHCQYMSNMGVRSSMTLPIVVNNELWGLFAFHNYEVRVPGIPVTLAAELAGKFISLILTKEQQRAWSRVVDSTGKIASTILNNALGEPTDWDVLSEQLLRFVSADGVALVCGDRITASHGSIPADRIVLAANGLTDVSSDPVVTTDSLRTQLQDHAHSAGSGAAVVAVAASNPLSIVFFRDASVQKIKWAGRPDKDIEKTPDGLRLNPRGSFDAYVQEVADRSDPWTQDDIQLLHGLHANLNRLASSQDELRISRNRLELYVSELNHRVRNTLSLIQSMTRQSRGAASSVEFFAEQLEQRIAALATGHNLLTAVDARNIDLRELVEQSLKAFINVHSGAINIQGIDGVILQPETAPLISLILHELASNATRHGALNAAEGRVDFSWSLTPTELHLSWRESGGSRVRVPERSGFGRSILENAIPHELDGSSTLEFLSSGLVYRASIPRSFLASESADKPDNNSEPNIVIKLGRALVVEDDFLISSDMVESLQTIGFTPVDSCSNNNAALAMINQHDYAFCVLDVNLRGSFVGPVADVLSHRGTPFVFATGFGSRQQELQGYPAKAIFTKPVQHTQLVKLVAGINERAHN